MVIYKKMKEKAIKKIIKTIGILEIIKGLIGSLVFIFFLYGWIQARCSLQSTSGVGGALCVLSKVISDYEVLFSVFLPLPLMNGIAILRLKKIWITLSIISHLLFILSVSAWIWLVFFIDPVLRIILTLILVIFTFFELIILNIPTIKRQFIG